MFHPRRALWARWGSLIFSQWGHQAHRAPWRMTHRLTAQAHVSPESRPPRQTGGGESTRVVLALEGLASFEDLLNRALGCQLPQLSVEEGTLDESSLCARIEAMATSRPNQITLLPDLYAALRETGALTPAVASSLLKSCELWAQHPKTQTAHSRVQAGSLIRVLLYQVALPSAAQTYAGQAGGAAGRLGWTAAEALAVVGQASVSLGKVHLPHADASVVVESLWDEVFRRGSWPSLPAVEGLLRGASAAGGDPAAVLRAAAAAVDVHPRGKWTPDVLHALARAVTEVLWVPHSRGMPAGKDVAETFLLLTLAAQLRQSQPVRDQTTSGERPKPDGGALGRGDEEAEEEEEEDQEHAPSRVHATLQWLLQDPIWAETAMLCLLEDQEGEEGAAATAQEWLRFHGASAAHWRIHSRDGLARWLVHHTSSVQDGISGVERVCAAAQLDISYFFATDCQPLSKLVWPVSIWRRIADAVSRSRDCGGDSPTGHRGDVTRWEHVLLGSLPSLPSLPPSRRTHRGVAQPSATSMDMLCCQVHAALSLQQPGLVSTAWFAHFPHTWPARASHALESVLHRFAAMPSDARTVLAVLETLVDAGFEPTPSFLLTLADSAGRAWVSHMASLPAMPSPAADTTGESAGAVMRGRARIITAPDPAPKGVGCPFCGVPTESRCPTVAARGARHVETADFAESTAASPPWRLYPSRQLAVYTSALPHPPSSLYRSLLRVAVSVPCAEEAWNVFAALRDRFRVRETLSTDEARLLVATCVFAGQMHRAWDVWSETQLRGRGSFPDQQRIRDLAQLWWKEYPRAERS